MCENVREIALREGDFSIYAIRLSVYRGFLFNFQIVYCVGQSDLRQ